MKVVRTLTKALIGLLCIAAFILTRLALWDPAGKSIHHPARLLCWCILILYLWPLVRFWIRKQTTNVIVTASAVVAIAASLMGDNSADLYHAMLFVVPFVFLVDLQLTLPRFFAVCVAFAGTACALLSFSSPTDIASGAILEWLIIVSVFPIWIWYWANRDEVWDRSVEKDVSNH